MRKKALICVQGINDKQGYLFSAVKSKKNKWLREQYDLIVDVETEKFFDKALCPIPFIKDSFLAQYMGDVWNFYKKHEARKAVCREVRRQILEKQIAEYDIDIIAHSLGTVITLCCGRNKGKDPIRINRFFCLASPLGIGNWFLRRGIWGIFQGTVNHFVKYSNNFIAKKMYYLYSPHDWISKVLDMKATKKLVNNAATPSSYYRAEKSEDVDHDAKEYLSFLRHINDRGLTA